MAVTTDRRRIVLREMTQADLPNVREIEKRAYADAWPATTFEAELRNAFATYIVAVEFAPEEPLEPAFEVRPTSWPLRWLAPPKEQPRGRLLGFCGMWFHVDQLHIVTIATDPAREGEGIGQRLLLDAFERGIEAELRNVALEVRPSNARARALYERFGFREQGRSRGYYKNNNEDAIIMLTDDLDSPAMTERLEAIRAAHAARFDAVEWVVAPSAPEDPA